AVSSPIAASLSESLLCGEQFPQANLQRGGLGAVGGPTQTSAGRSIVRGTRGRSVNWTVPAVSPASPVSSQCPASSVTVIPATSCPKEPSPIQSRHRDALFRSQLSFSLVRGRSHTLLSVVEAVRTERDTIELTNSSARFHCG